ncbi:MAG: class I SAM-dependent methyltransferase [Candidatus Eremiobacteraeota bacterium]|nr:class I SAM-dependent methyltransferase [Candidatus Eremiobacteraeota bacterium]
MSSSPPDAKRAAALERIEEKAQIPLYREPRLYDIAFGFRDIPEECDGLLALARAHGVPGPKSVVELACGPAHHLRELASRGLHAVGVDINPLMLGYARTLCRRDNVPVTFRRADMRTYRLDTRADLAICLFDSFALCVSDRDAVETLRHTHAVLRRGGLFILEFSHPADFFGTGRSRTLDEWTERSSDLSVHTRFTLTRFDAVAETFVADLRLQSKDRKTGRRGRSVRMRWVQRMWFRSAVQYVASASGRFDIVGWYGDIDPRVPLDTQDEAWRMLVVLKAR